MQGLACAVPNAPDHPLTHPGARLTTHPGERLTFATLALVLLGTLLPIGPAIPATDAGAVPTQCPGPVPRWQSGHGSPCAFRDQVAFAAPSAALRIAAILVP